MEHPGLFIRGADLVAEDRTFTGDILVRDEAIVEMGPGLKHPGPKTREIDGTGLIVLPGGIDPHVHMELPVPGGLVSCDDFTSGSKAALAGGTTTIIDFVTPVPGQSLAVALEERQTLAARSFCDYGLHMSIVSPRDDTPAEMARCLEEKGISSFKVYLAYKETIGLEDGDLVAVMDAAAGLGVLVAAHCEHGDMIAYLQKKLLGQGKGTPRFHARSRPPEVEAEAVGRALLTAKITGCPLYLVHISTRDALGHIARARGEGQKVWAETCPHYLLLDEGRYDLPAREAAACVMSPPLRSGEHGDALWGACGDGTLQVVATDHCPFHLEGQKDRGLEDFTLIPNGVAGVENRMALLYTYGVLEKKITLRQFVDQVATWPAKIFGLYPRKGVLRPGADADLVLWDPGAESVISARTHYQNCDTNIYEGFALQGQPRLVTLRGRVVFEGGRFSPNLKPGRYLHRTRPFE